ncbi:hypothetical protein A3D80_03350 [Candidatus Roizmanbacteria bacterium RIFCSPHIGHO2_02_FULL_40_13b]|uniref:Plasmid stabilization protein n=1 Tax=Candidatus Roizmanbacteria bacterium RIFCSPHIGHO2_01_FULL_39_24 TaxID=1802032 RepID=A0A1F7GM10_9BACT|nr:MAG: hypothetical protein A2799_01095 [Candidatus Roizmanbacteria bacterium RIFCSPHIGHO2_01_FULL_39_24]OGK27002.1 MAG: hypothetical protein A3D80_03350 [Candidatus Roizmanbacteria bacterium RIFCSPHIGHO2_02_FULL_40_13b]OGK48843.1 MAG: hypothetical protein A3A56_01375 [Candidatus Roizmanbacteria bacterium RIFCSPLOWO2_01_FULL_40_32]OGK57323.1 MAG: hypothetical protein A3H83_00600 [Candidatus Roizmanbacteria bacterium RIFCSPLOWO2_02_FULL_39_8]
MFTVIIAPKAKRQLKLIPKRFESVISLIIRELKEDPFYWKPLTRELIGKFSSKVGPFRIIYIVNEKDKIVNIISVGHRGVVYK